jgi:signal transduction histidine kinase
MSTPSLPNRSWLSDIPWLVPLGLVVLLGSWFTNTEHGGSTGGGGPVLAVLCAAVAVGCLLVALRSPVPGVVGNVVAVIAFVAIPLEDGPIYLTLGAAAFLIAARRAPAQWIPPVAGGATLVGIALLLRGVTDTALGRSLWQVVAVFGVICAGAAFGTLARARRQAVHERAERGATEEKLKMAQDLHDGVGHGLAVIAMQAGVGLHVLDSDPAAVRGALEAIRDTSRESLDALRAELTQLAGEPAARQPRPGLVGLDVLVERVRAAGPDVSVTGSARDLPEAVDTAAYAIVQEALTNVLRHSSATKVGVAIGHEAGAVTVVVADNGPGAAGDQASHQESHQQSHRQGMGLRGMRARVTALGGSLVAGPSPAGGFEVRAVLPVETDTG